MQTKIKSKLTLVLLITFLLAGCRSEDQPVPVVELPTEVASDSSTPTDEPIDVPATGTEESEVEVTTDVPATEEPASIPEALPESTEIPENPSIEPTPTQDVVAVEPTVDTEAQGIPLLASREYLEDLKVRREADIQWFRTRDNRIPGVGFNFMDNIFAQFDQIIQGRLSLNEMPDTVEAVVVVTSFQTNSGFTGLVQDTNGEFFEVEFRPIGEFVALNSSNNSIDVLPPQSINPRAIRLIANNQVIVNENEQILIKVVTGGVFADEFEALWGITVEQALQDLSPVVENAGFLNFIAIAYN